MSNLFGFVAIALACSLLSAPPPARAAPAATPASPPLRLYVADGQLASHIFVVMVTDQIDESMQPALRFIGSHWFMDPAPVEAEPIKPLFVAPRQTRTVLVNGEKISVEGTLLLFDLNKYKLPFLKSAVRLLPRVEWTVPASAAGQAAVNRVAMAESEIYLGNMLGAAIWTAVLIVLITLAFLLWSGAKSKQVKSFRPRPALLLVTGADGYLSLWRTQLLVWTYAVGSLVFLFGLLRLKVPEIPETLVALMGMSVLTGLAAKKAAGPSPAPAPAAPPPPAPTPNPGLAQWSDLVSTWNGTTKQVELSIPKAQMVLWTVLIVTLFCVKSVLDGTLWPVPWELVILTGFSQGGYVGDKFVAGTT